MDVRDLTPSPTDPALDANDPVVRAFLQSVKDDGAWIFPSDDGFYRIDGAISLRPAIYAAIKAYLAE